MAVVATLLMPTIVYGLTYLVQPCIGIPFNEIINSKIINSSCLLRLIISVIAWISLMFLFYRIVLKVLL